MSMNELCMNNENTNKSDNKKAPGVMMQYFEWYLPADASLWRTVSSKAKELKESGFTALWLPPAYKGQAGINDVGYGVYDMYDLGEFDQKGTIPTKYGTKAEYIKAVSTLKKNGIDVYADVVFNHRMGADGSEVVKAHECDAKWRDKLVSGEETIEAWTKFDFPGRNGKYSDFKWNHTHFNGVDWNQKESKSAIYLFEGTNWQKGVDEENGNYDYLMGADLDFDNPAVREELLRWGKWYLETVKPEGFRLDAVKHIASDFFEPWLDELRKESGKELFTVGEYWHIDTNRLVKYLDCCNNKMSLFDVPLHLNFYKACNCSGQFDMSKIFENTLTGIRPSNSVTFVENHDTQPGQALQSVVLDWFKPLAYALILLRPYGYPCVFYGDYYGLAVNGGKNFKKEIDVMIRIRQTIMKGQLHDYFDNYDAVGWTFEGDETNKESGFAVLLTDGCDATKRMYIGATIAGKTFIDIMGGYKEAVVIDNEGFGEFKVSGGSVSIWVEVTRIEDNLITVVQ